MVAYLGYVQVLKGSFAVFELVHVFQKYSFEMPRHSQSWIFLLKAYPQYLQYNALSFQDFHNFHK